MKDQLTNQPLRNLVPLEKFNWETKYIVGVPNQTPSLSEDMVTEMMKSDGALTDNKILLKSLCPPQEALYGEEANESRFVFEKGPMIGQGGLAQIYRGMDRLTGKICVAKVIDRQTSDDYREPTNEMIQREGEIMKILHEDEYLRDHIAEVFDVAEIKIRGENSVVIFEEYMDGSSQPSLERSDRLIGMPNETKIEIIRQICEITDRLAEWNIFHHDLSDGNIYFNTSNKLVKISDLGSSNFALDVSRDGVLANPNWVSPEREIYNGDTPDPGLTSEVFSLTALAFYIMTNGEKPYSEDMFPSKRAVYFDSKNLFRTSFRPASKLVLQRELGDDFSEQQIDRLTKVFEIGLAINPKDRYQSGKELFCEIMNVLYPEDITSFVREEK